jgi:antitoxin VapB
MTRTTLFKSNWLQAVRLPKDVAFPEGVREVHVLRDGKRRVLVPSNSAWNEFFDAPGIGMPKREQPVPRKRKSL